VNISMPRIVLPTIPAVDIQMPRIKIPNVRVVRRTNGPI